MSQIFFNGKTDLYEFLSNFHYIKGGVIIDGKQWPTTEHYFQASKFIYPGCPKNNLIYSELIRITDSPSKARALGMQDINGKNARWYINKPIGLIVDTTTGPISGNTTFYELLPLLHNVKLNPNWNTYRITVMEKAIIHKFNIPYLKNYLLSTGNSELIELAPWDDFWGTGPRVKGVYKGTNMLGKMLVCLRGILKMK